MNIIWAIILGVVQGLTEFFPVSSSGHLVLTPYILGFKDPGLAFDIALHSGTLLAIFAALFADWKALTKSIFDKKMASERRMILFLLVTSVPGALAGYFLESKADSVFRNPILVASTLIIFGLILWAVDKYLGKDESMAKMTFGKSFLIGLSQAIAIIPGVSRSGATITAGRALGLSRETAVKYSFMAALPIIAGASVFGLRDTQLSEALSATWVLGFVASFISSFWAIKFLPKYVKNHDFNIFLWWRIFLAILVFIIIYWR